MYLVLVDSGVEVWEYHLGVGVNVWGMRLQAGGVVVDVVVLVVVVVVGVGGPGVVVVGVVALGGAGRGRVEVGQGGPAGAALDEAGAARLEPAVVRVSQRNLRR